MNLFDIFYLMIPAYVANMTPVFVRKIKWDTPIDFGTELFGNHKTWRGLFFGTFAGMFVCSILSNFYWPISVSPIAWGFLAGFGALIGDLAKSFFKRIFKILPGKPWIPFDQIDYSIGALLFGSIVFFPGFFYASIVVAVSLFAHIIANHIAFYLKIRNEKW